MDKDKIIKYLDELIEQEYSWALYFKFHFGNISENNCEALKNVINLIEYDIPPDLIEEQMDGTLIKYPYGLLEIIPSEHNQYYILFISKDNILEYIEINNGSYFISYSLINQYQGCSYQEKKWFSLDFENIRINIPIPSNFQFENRMKSIIDFLNNKNSQKH